MDGERGNRRLRSGRHWTDRARGLHLPAAVVSLALSGGCGSAAVGELPPAAGPARSPPLSAAPAGRLVRGATVPVAKALIDDGRTVAVVSGRERVLELYDIRTHQRSARAPAGVGPTNVACLERTWCYVVDTRGEALLVFRRGSRLELVRRYHLRGAPYGIALDERRRLIYVTLPARNELVQLPAHGRPHVVGRWTTVRQPDTVAVDHASGRVFVTGPTAGVVQIVSP
jgi:hypothetical protein